MKITAVECLILAGEHPIVRVEDGTIAVPDGPGLGVDVDEALVRRLATISVSSACSKEATLRDDVPPGL